MKKLGLIIGFALMMVFISASAQAQISYVFGMSGRGLLYTNSSITTSMLINSFHGSSETWQLHIEPITEDKVPYDNITISIDCTSGDSAVFSTLDYSTWVNHGYIRIPLVYEAATSTIHYNSIPLEADTVRCDFRVLYINQSNNTVAYHRRYFQMIPYYISLEYVDCTGFDDNFGISFSGQVTTVVTMMEESWSILHTVYSIAIIIFTIIGVPILVFIILRWAIYRITGHKLIEGRER